MYIREIVNKVYVKADDGKVLIIDNDKEIAKRTGALLELVYDKSILIPDIYEMDRNEFIKIINQNEE